jgi:hypothetical protein
VSRLLRGKNQTVDAIAGLGCNLDLGGADQVVAAQTKRWNGQRVSYRRPKMRNKLENRNAQGKPGLSHAAAGSEDAVILEHEDVLVAEVLDELLLHGLLGDEPFKFVAPGLSAELRRLREGREEPGLGAREPRDGRDVVVRNGGGALAASTVDRAVYDEPGPIHAKDVADDTRMEDLALQVDLEERRRGDLVVAEAVRVDQERLRAVGLLDGNRDVVEDA